MGVEVEEAVTARAFEHGDFCRAFRTRANRPALAVQVAAHFVHGRLAFEVRPERVQQAGFGGRRQFGSRLQADIGLVSTKRGGRRFAIRHNDMEATVDETAPRRERFQIDAGRLIFGARCHESCDTLQKCCRGQRLPTQFAAPFLNCSHGAKPPRDSITGRRDSERERRQRAAPSARAAVYRDDAGIDGGEGRTGNDKAQGDRDCVGSHGRGTGRKLLTDAGRQTGHDEGHRTGEAVARRYRDINIARLAGHEQQRAG